MAADRTSRDYDLEFYTTTRRGRSLDADIGHEMFPSKYEGTPYLDTSLNENRYSINESPDMLYEFNREELRDGNSPVTSSLFPYEEQQRRTYGTMRLNLQAGGFVGSLTDPYMPSGYNLSFQDKDPRGYLNEPDWRNLRQQAEVRHRYTNFSNDADYSITSGHVHPQTLYAQIRGAQDWVKARLRVFDESFTGRQNGGVGVFPTTSILNHSDYEPTTVLTDGGNINNELARTVDKTMKLSNMVHGGKAFISGTTTDHKVKTSGYGKLYRSLGIIPHETQMRMVEDDTRWSKVEGRKHIPRNLVKLMSSATTTAASEGRKSAQENMLDKVLAPGMKGDSEANTNRGLLLTKDIMALLGYTENEVKYLEEHTGGNKTHKQLALANLKQLTEQVHALPANVKLQLRDDLMILQAGGSLKPGNIRATMNKTVVNPKIVEKMDNATRFTGPHGDVRNNTADGDPEGILDIKNTPLMVFKNRDRSIDDIAIKHSVDGTINGDTKITNKYKNMARIAKRAERNRRMINNTQGLQQALGTQTRANPIKPHNITEILKETILDNDFGENRCLDRRIGKIGSKYINRNVVSDYYNPKNEMDEVGAIDGVASRRRKHQTL